MAASSIIGLYGGLRGNGLNSSFGMKRNKGL